MKKMITTAALAAMIFTAGSATAVPPTPERKCEAGKNDAVGKYAACAAKAERFLVLTGDTAKYGQLLTKCESKLVASWNKLEAAAVALGATCPSTGDQSSIEGFVDSCVQSVAVAVGGGTLGADPVTCNTDLTVCNGDLTTCDGSLTTCNGDLTTTRTTSTPGTTRSRRKLPRSMAAVVLRVIRTGECRTSWSCRAS